MGVFGLFGRFYQKIKKKVENTKEKGSNATFVQKTVNKADIKAYVT